jgi:serine palmitoyltransferase
MNAILGVEGSTGTAAVDVTQWMPNLYSVGYSVGYWYGTTFVASATSGSSTAAAAGTANDAMAYAIQVLETVQSFPLLYSQWWWDLVQTNPLHVLVETTLILCIFYILLYRTRTDWRSNSSERLTPKEEEQLLQEWKLHGRAPLTPSSSNESGGVSVGGPFGILPPPVIVHRVDGAHMMVETPKPTTADDTISDTSSKKENNATATTTTTTTPTVMQKVLNLATHDYLGLSRHPKVQKAAEDALRHFGCGSCGPRGFYGTMDAHLALEEAAADWLGTEAAILYSDGASCIASTIASFAKRGDLVVVDEACSEPIQTGVSLSRAHVRYFKHNDMKDLEQLLTSIQAKDKEMGRKPNAQRRFLVAESVYQRAGTVCKLKELVALKHKFSYRLMLDETNAMGVLGPTGRGLTEACGLVRQRDVEITCWSLEHAAGSIGGLTQGTEQVVEHQRLSGAGYCFSASSPPFTAVAATKAIELMKDGDENERTVSPHTTANLQRIIATVHVALRELCTKALEDVVLVTSDAASPIQVLELADWPATRTLDQGAFWAAVVQEGWKHGVAWASSEHGLRWIVNSLLTEEDIRQALKVLEDAVQHVLDVCLPPEEENTM